MKTRLLCVLLAVATGFSAWADGGKIKVLVLTGGHEFKAAPFFEMFEENPEITFTADKQIKAAEGYDRADLYSFDAVVLYDAPRNITEEQKGRFLGLFDKGIGVVVLHHAYLAYPMWPEFGRIAGGQYIYAEGQLKAGLASSTYKGNVDIPVTVVDTHHPVTAGLSDFVLHDELYSNMHMIGDVTPLLKNGDELLAWTRMEKNSRVVGTIVGHGCYSDPNFRKFLEQSIRWVAKGH
ncbi:MAG TPA: ThuA domain-containing protein [Verrucomicrobiae bacterium]|nr:ThuA domain-containing protein [Verrucomicrobiae bacterium]